MLYRLRLLLSLLPLSIQEIRGSLSAADPSSIHTTLFCAVTRSTLPPGLSRAKGSGYFLLPSRSALYKCDDCLSVRLPLNHDLIQPSSPSSLTSCSADPHRPRASTVPSLPQRHPDLVLLPRRRPSQLVSLPRFGRSSRRFQRTEGGTEISSSPSSVRRGRKKRSVVCPYRPCPCPSARQGAAVPISLRLFFCQSTKLIKLFSA
jgi:hypothetical protein